MNNMISLSPLDVHPMCCVVDLVNRSIPITSCSLLMLFFCAVIARIFIPFVLVILLKYVERDDGGYRERM